METNLKSTHPMVLVAAGSLTLASLAATAHFTGLIGGNAPALTAPAVVAAAPAPVAAPVIPAATAPAAPLALGSVTAPAATLSTSKTEGPATLTIPPGATVTVTPQGVKPVSQVASAPRRPAVRPVRENAANPAGEGNLRRVSRDNGIDVIPARAGQMRTGSPPETANPHAPLCRECGTVEAVREAPATVADGTGLGAIAGGLVGGLLGNQVGKGKGKDLATIAIALGGAYAGHQVEKHVRGDKQVQVTVRFEDGNVQTYTQSANTNWYPGEKVRLSNGALLPV